MAYVRISGSSNRYLNTDTGETISRRQYDKIQGVLAQRGFTSYEQQQKAGKYSVYGPFPVQKSIWHVHNIGLPQNLAKAIETVVKNSPHFGTKMMLRVEGTIYGDGRPYKRWYGTTVWKKIIGVISEMIDELMDSIADYDVEFIPEHYELTFIDRSE